MSDKAAAPKDLQRVVELLPEGKVPGGFARDFCQIFRPEIEARFIAPTRDWPAGSGRGPIEIP